MMQDFQKQLRGYGLTTANILYRRPDHPWLLQTYVWPELTTSAQISGTAQLFAILAKISRRNAALGHSRAFSPHQTGRDQSGGWRFQVKLIGPMMHDHGRLPIDLSHIGQRSGPTAARSVEAHLRQTSAGRSYPRGSPNQGQNIQKPLPGLGDFVIAPGGLRRGGF